MRSEDEVRAEIERRRTEFEQYQEKRQLRYSTPEFVTALEWVLGDGKQTRDHWDVWYATLPADLKRHLSLHDFKRLGDRFKLAFRLADEQDKPKETGK